MLVIAECLHVNIFFKRLSCTPIIIVFEIYDSFHLNVTYLKNCNYIKMKVFDLI